MSAVLLRKQLTRTGDDDDSAFIYPRIAESTRLTLKSVITSLQQESTKSIAKKVCDTISELASAILPENGSADVELRLCTCAAIDFIKALVSADNWRVKEGEDDLGRR
ncbi:unnamed protein product [Arabidopsis lyrata]|uniref:Uncharacterized protein n=1 Tax=Arabidopsis lyrata subsp. lyrata TaxID=81972 RepID=D7KF19_ARALL|nr:hypothetical protein ARALYDRAFT_891892 [Arabidopsis lyrata subsp. lyrata]CAH8255102.1 unnamed protein product [Arabidopsis lyrata]